MQSHIGNYPGENLGLKYLNMDRKNKDRHGLTKMKRSLIAGSGIFIDSHGAEIRGKRLLMLRKSPPRDGSSEADDCGESKDHDADEADVRAAFGQKHRDGPWKVRAESELDNRGGYDDGNEDDPNRG